MKKRIVKNGITLVDSRSQLGINSLIIFFLLNVLFQGIDLKRIKFLIQ